MWNSLVSVFFTLFVLQKLFLFSTKLDVKKKTKKKTYIWHFWHISSEQSVQQKKQNSLMRWLIDLSTYGHIARARMAPRFDWNLKNGRINLPQCTTTLLALGAPERVTEHTSASRGAVFGYLEVFHSAYPRVLSSKVWVAIKSNIPPHFSVQFKDSISVFHHLFVYVQPIKTT